MATFAVHCITLMVPSSFFPSGITHYFTTERYGPETLAPSERAVSAKWGSKRISDFCTGRYCLRRCTEVYGYFGDIPVGARGMPVLPAHLTASVSHSRALSGAIAADTQLFTSIGLDIEATGRVHSDMWHLLFTPAEMHFLNSIPSEFERQIVSTAFFSLKEAFYKMQFPLTSTFLDLHDAEVRLTTGGYMLELLTDAGDLPRGQLFSGIVHYNGQEVITFCALPAL